MLNKFSFTKSAKYFISGSVAVIILGVIFAFLHGGLNFGIDFTGGTLMTINMGGEFNDQDVKDVLVKLGVNDAPVVKSGQNGAQDQAIIRMKDSGNVEQERQTRINIVSGLKEKYSSAYELSFQRVGAVSSSELIKNAIIAVLIASVGILIYVWIRFELISGIAAIVALLHDVLIMLAFCAIINLPINSSFIAAVLTIVGYSINDTIVVFDRIRENDKIYTRKEKSQGAVVDISVKETLTRTLYTSLTTLLTITVLYILGVQTIKEFALPIIVGLISGTYSSIFIASPIWVLWEDSRGKKDKSKKGNKPSVA